MKFKTKKAFTLIEVIIVIAIVAIMTGVLLTAMSDSRSRTELEVATNQISASLRETQNYALTGKIDAGNNCSGYRLITSSGSDTYSISGSGCTFNMTQKITGGVVFQGAASITFGAPHGTKIGSSGIRLTKNGNSMYVCVNGVGLITKKETICP